MTVHILKCDHELFDMVWSGRVDGGFAVPDRGYQTDDTVKMCERKDGIETGRAYFCSVVRVWRGGDLPDRQCLLSVKELLKTRDW